MLLYQDTKCNFGNGHSTKKNFLQILIFKLPACGLTAIHAVYTSINTECSLYLIYFIAPSPLKKDSGIKVTVPHTPNFQTTCRQRPTHIVSAAEKEEQEVQDMAKLVLLAKFILSSLFLYIVV